MIDAQLSRLNIVVLAAGFSRRLGRTKTLTRIHGTTLLRRTLCVLARVTNQPILVITPPRATSLRAALQGCPVVLRANASRAGGLSTSIVLALRYAPLSGATLFVPADLPDLTPRDLSRLIGVWRGHRRKVVARVVTGRAVVPLILPRFLYPRALRISGDVGLRDMIATLPAEDRLMITMPSAVVDIDTRRQLAEARRRFRALHPYGGR